MKKFQYTWLLMLALGFVACDSDDDNGSGGEAQIEVTSGDADFSTYVSVGNSLTAGYTDGALFAAGQQNSMTNILSQKFALAGGGAFTIPYMNDNIGGATLGGMQILENRLFFNGSGPQRLPGTPTTEISDIHPGPYNNMGVPGAKSYHLTVNGYGNVAGVQAGLANPYFVRMASSPTASVIEDALAQSPTFFSLWIGNNDILGYATSGASGVNQTGNLNPATYASNDITDPNVFAQVYSGLVTALTAGGAGGVVANIPDVTALPFFTTVPYNPVPLDAATAGALNQGFAAYNAALVQLAIPPNEMTPAIITEAERDKRLINFAAGANAVVIVDENLVDLSGFGLPSYRHATADDLLILPSSTFIGTLVGNNPQLVNGLSVPLADNWVLTPQEQAEIADVIEAYNDIIEAVAEQNGLAMVDVHALMNQISLTGVTFDEFSLNGSLVFGGAFSLDGVHPTARGYAFLANQFLLAIDETYGSNFEAAGVLAKAADYTTLFPAMLP